MPNEETVALLPCAHCEADGHLMPVAAGSSVRFRVECEHCHIETPTYSSEAGAITAWNTRAAAMGWRDIDPFNALTAAYVAGATAVHNHWASGNEEREADFYEAACDYARATLPTPPEPTT